MVGCYIFVGNKIAIRIDEILNATFLWYGLPDKSIDIFVGATFPGAVLRYVRSGG